MSVNVNELLEEIDELTKCFYQQKINEGLNKMNSLLDNILLWINQYNAENQNVEENNKILSSLLDAEKAMESKDYVTLADILQFDLAPAIKSVVE